jgi:uncharacterized protein
VHSCAPDSRVRLGSERGRALITGATSGIGAAFAERYARDGFNVVLHGRRAARLTEAAEQLEARYGIQAEALVADLASTEGIRAVEAQVAGDQELRALVNNAGFTPLLPFEKTEPDEIEAMIQVHVVALTRLTRGAVPGMIQRRQGEIINVASDGIFVQYPQSLMATYAATKAYVEMFTRGIYRMALESNVRVQVLCPGFVTSEILDRHGISFEDWGIPESAVMSAPMCVDVSMAALELGEVVCVPTLSQSDLLDSRATIDEEIRAQSSGTGVPAARYGLSARGRS